MQISVQPLDVHHHNQSSQNAKGTVAPRKTVSDTDTASESSYWATEENNNMDTDMLLINENSFTIENERKLYMLSQSSSEENIIYSHVCR